LGVIISKTQERALVEIRAGLEAKSIAPEQATQRLRNLGLSPEVLSVKEGATIAAVPYGAQSKSAGHDHKALHATNPMSIRMQPTSSASAEDLEKAKASLIAAVGEDNAMKFIARRQESVAWMKSPERYGEIADKLEEEHNANLKRAPQIQALVAKIEGPEKDTELSPDYQANRLISLLDGGLREVYNESVTNAADAHEDVRQRFLELAVVGFVAWMDAHAQLGLATLDGKGFRKVSRALDTLPKLVGMNVEVAPEDARVRAAKTLGAFILDKVAARFEREADALVSKFEKQGALNYDDGQALQDVVVKRDFLSAALAERATLMFSTTHLRREKAKVEETDRLLKDVRAAKARGSVPAKLAQDAGFYVMKPFRDAALDELHAPGFLAKINLERDRQRALAEELAQALRAPAASANGPPAA
jgi:hypothetical protein